MEDVLSALMDTAPHTRIQEFTGFYAMPSNLPITVLSQWFLLIRREMHTGRTYSVSPKLLPAASVHGNSGLFFIPQLLRFSMSTRQLHSEDSLSLWGCSQRMGWLSPSAHRMDAF